MIITEMEKAKVAQLASEYRDRGYNVRIQPTSPDLPSFLAGFAPDILATSDHDNVVVEVRSARNFDAEQIQQLAEVLQSQPSWKFEVVLVNPPVAPDVPAEEDLASDEQVNRSIANAEILT